MSLPIPLTSNQPLPLPMASSRSVNWTWMLRRPRHVPIAWLSFRPSTTFVGRLLFRVWHFGPGSVPLPPPQRSMPPRSFNGAVGCRVAPSIPALVSVIRLNAGPRGAGLRLFRSALVRSVDTLESLATCPSRADESISAVPSWLRSVVYELRHFHPTFTST